MNINLNLHGTEAPTAVNVLRTDDGRSFLMIDIGPEVTIAPPGFGPECAQWARDLGLKLITAAAQMPELPKRDESPNVDVVVPTESTTEIPF